MIKAYLRTDVFEDAAALIANFLNLNGIEYAYEKPYPHGDIMYRPDFYLKDYDIYLEHLGG